MYKLRYERAAEAVWDSLPDIARDELDRALVAVCKDPYAATDPARSDGDVKRILALQHSMVMFVIIEPPIKRLRILQITCLG